MAITGIKTTNNVVDPHTYAWEIVHYVNNGSGLLEPSWIYGEYDITTENTS